MSKLEEILKRLSTMKAGDWDLKDNTVGHYIHDVEFLLDKIKYIKPHQE